MPTRYNSNNSITDHTVLRSSFQYIEQNHQELDIEIIDLSQVLLIQEQQQQQEEENAKQRSNKKLDEDSSRKSLGRNGSFDLPSSLNMMKLITWSREHNTTTNNNNSNSSSSKKKHNKHSNSSDNSKNTVIHKNELQPYLYFPLKIKTQENLLKINDQYFLLKIYKSIDTTTTTITNNNISNGTNNNKFIDNFSINSINSTYKNKDIEFVEYCDLKIPCEYGDYFVDYSWVPLTREEEQEQEQEQEQNNTLQRPIYLMIVTNTHFLYFDISNGSAVHQIYRSRSIYAGLDELKKCVDERLVPDSDCLETVFLTQFVSLLQNKYMDLSSFKKTQNSAIWYKLYKKKPLLSFVEKDFTLDMPELIHDFEFLKKNSGSSRRNGFNDGSNNNDDNDNDNDDDNGGSFNLDANGIKNHTDLYWFAMESMYGPMIGGKNQALFKNSLKLKNMKKQVLQSFQQDLGTSNTQSCIDKKSNNQLNMEDHTSQFSNYLLNICNTYHSADYQDQQEHEDQSKNKIKNNMKRELLHDQDALVLDREVNVFLTVLSAGLVVLDIDSHFQIPIFLNMNPLSTKEDEEQDYKLKLYDNNTLLIYNENSVICSNISHLFDNYLILNLAECFGRFDGLLGYYGKVLSEKIINDRIKPFINFWSNLVTKYNELNTTDNNKEKSSDLISDLINLFTIGECNSNLKRWFTNILGLKNLKKWKKIYQEMYNLSIELTMLTSTVERLIIELGNLYAYLKAFCVINQLNCIEIYVDFIQDLKLKLNDLFLIPLNIINNTFLKAEYKKHFEFLNWLTMWFMHFSNEKSKNNIVQITPPDKINLIMDFMLQNLSSSSSSSSGECNLLLFNFYKKNIVDWKKLVFSFDQTRINMVSFVSILIMNDMDVFEPINETFKIKDVAMINKSIHAIQHSTVENSLQIYDLEHDIPIIDLIKDFTDDDSVDEDQDMSDAGDAFVYASRKNKKRKQHKIISSNGGDGRYTIVEALFVNNNCTNSATNNYDVKLLVE